MSLQEYKRKRDFTLTAEPAGKVLQAQPGRKFVVQKHAASRLHYDFRLEMDGVLKSWAVPKGFSATRGERRLAVHVEDHPLDYAGFEGTIPQGQYGGGTVMVWDFGTYETGEEDPAAALAAGKLRCVLQGEKLKGEWTLVRSGRDGDEKNWFLIKTGAERVRPISKKQEEHSALTGRTLEQIAAEKGAVWHSGPPDIEKGRKPASKPNAAAPKPKRKAVRGLAKPRWLEPMKATLADAPPAGDDWVYELKWDGYRALAIKDGAQVELISRNQKPLTASFPELAEAVAALPAETAIIDAEICALDEKGRPRFQLLQGREMNRARPDLFLYAFDLLHLNGHDLLEKPLRERKAALESLLGPDAGRVRFSGFIEGDVQALLEQVRSVGLEGLIGKRRESTYQPGLRSREWIKVKVVAEQEFVIGGCTPPQGARSHFGALLVGYFEGTQFGFAGKVGTGFNQAWLKQLWGMIRERVLPECPFADLPKKGSGRWNQGISRAEMRRCTWCRPELVSQLKFTEWTEDGSLRHPVFLGLREDKAAREVRREAARG